MVVAVVAETAMVDIFGISKEGKPNWKYYIGPRKKITRNCPVYHKTSGSTGKSVNFERFLCVGRASGEGQFVQTSRIVVEPEPRCVWRVAELWGYQRTHSSAPAG